MYKSIFIATDDSKNSLRAVKEVLNFNYKEVNVTLVHVKDARATRNTILHLDATVSEKKDTLDVLQEATNFLENNGIHYDIKLLHGEVSESLIKEMNNGNYDVALIGRTGKSIFKELMIGRVSKKVLKAAEIPVLVVQ